MFGRSFLAHWPLDPHGVYLNHGTVGVTPTRILAVQRGILDEIERHPARFLLRELAAVNVGESRGPSLRLRAAADAIAPFYGVRGDDLVFVDNATTGANAVLRSFPFQAGDEVLVTDLGYGGVTRAAMFATRERGATVRTVTMPWPFRPEALERAWIDAVGPRTRMAIVDHISAESALVFPLAAIARGLRAKGVAVLADGAHAPGSIPLDIASIGVDWYVGNLHKWGWTPRSSGILWAPPERQTGLHPAVISWGLDEGYTKEFDLVGTRDPSPHLSAPAAVALFREWGVEAVQRYMHDLAWQAGHRLAERWGTAFDTPESLIGTMVTVPLPPSLGRTRDEALALRASLLYDAGIEVQVHAYREQLHARVSAQVYNDFSDIDRLAEAVLRRA